MTMQSYALTPGRIERFKGEILKHAKPFECLSLVGRQIQMPKNNSKTYVARRWLPYGATAAQPNQFFQNGTGDRGNALVQAHLTAEGITPNPDSITPQDVVEVIYQYSCLYGFTDVTFDLYEDDIPEQMKIQIGERVALVNEMICYGKLKTSTNQFYGGTGTSRATVNGSMTLNLQRAVVRGLQANHAMPMTRILKASPNFDTSAVAAGYYAYCHTDLEGMIRDLPGFTPVEKYATGEAQPNEIGKTERFRWITSPELIPFQDAGAAVGATGLFSTSGSNIDVYPVIVMGQDAFSQIAVRGSQSLDPTYLPPGQKDKSDPHGQRGYAGSKWYKATMLENQGWMAVVNVGRPT